MKECCFCCCASDSWTGSELLWAAAHHNVDHVKVCVCVWVCGCVCVCVCVAVWLCLRASVCVHVSVFVHLHMCMCGFALRTSRSLAQHAPL